MPSKSTAFRLVLQTLTSQRGPCIICSLRISVCLREATYRACQSQLAHVAESCSCRDGGATNPAVISLGLWAGVIKHWQEEHTSVFHKESSCSQTHRSLWCVYSFGWYWFLSLWYKSSLQVEITYQQTWWLKQQQLEQDFATAHWVAFRGFLHCNRMGKLCTAPKYAHHAHVRDLLSNCVWSVLGWGHISNRCLSRDCSIRSYFEGRTI